MSLYDRGARLLFARAEALNNAREKDKMELAFAEMKLEVAEANLARLEEKQGRLEANLARLQAEQGRLEEKQGRLQAEEELASVNSSSTCVHTAFQAHAYSCTSARAQGKGPSSHSTSRPCSFRTNFPSCRTAACCSRLWLWKPSGR